MIKKVYRESFFGARDDVDPYRDERARENALTASKKKRLRKLKLKMGNEERLRAEKGEVSKAKRSVVKMVEDKIREDQEAEMEQVDDVFTLETQKETVEAIIDQDDTIQVKGDDRSTAASTDSGGGGE